MNVFQKDGKYQECMRKERSHFIPSSGNDLKSSISSYVAWITLAKDELGSIEPVSGARERNPEVTLVLTSSLRNDDGVLWLLFVRYT